MWQLTWNEKEHKWEVRDFTRTNLLDDEENSFHFYEDAEFECELRNIRWDQAQSFGTVSVPFWQESEE